MNIRIMLADDHILVRKGIRCLLEAEEGMEIVGEAGDGEECIELLGKLEGEYSIPDILLLDINMPRKNGIEVLREIRDLKINIKVLLLTGCDDSKLLTEGMKMGAMGCLLKSAEPFLLKKAIQTIQNGGTYVQPELIQPKLRDEMESLDPSPDSSNSPLTNREMEVLKLVAKGMLNKEIADSLCISERTVKNHLSSLYKKINVGDRTQAAIYAIRSGVVRI